MKLGIAILSNEKTINKLINIQKKINLFEELEPIFDLEGNLPHTTILQGRFKSLNYIKSILPKIEKYINSLNKPLKFHPTKLEYVESGWYFLKIDSLHWINDLHSYVFSLLKDEMYLTDNDKIKDISSYTEQQKNNYLTYGYRYIGDSYSPHITIGRTLQKNRSENEKKVENIVKEIIEENIFIKQVTIYRFGKNGSHAEILASIEL